MAGPFRDLRCEEPAGQIAWRRAAPRAWVGDAAAPPGYRSLANGLRCVWGGNGALVVGRARTRCAATLLPASALQIVPRCDPASCVGRSGAYFVGPSTTLL